MNFNNLIKQVLEGKESIFEEKDVNSSTINEIFTVYNNPKYKSIKRNQWKLIEDKIIIPFIHLILKNDQYKRLFTEKIREFLNNEEEKFKAIILMMIFFQRSSKIELEQSLIDLKLIYYEIFKDCIKKDDRTDFWYNLDRLVSDIFSNEVKDDIEIAIKYNNFNRLWFVFRHDFFNLMNERDAISLFSSSRLIIFFIKNIKYTDESDFSLGLHFSENITSYVKKHIAKITTELIIKYHNNRAIIRAILRLDLIFYLSKIDVEQLLQNDDIDFLNILLENCSDELAEDYINTFYKKHNINNSFILSEIISSFKEEKLNKIYRFLKSYSLNLFSGETLKDLIEDPEIDFLKKIIKSVSKLDIVERISQDWIEYLWFDDAKNELVHEILRDQITNVLRSNDKKSIRILYDMRLNYF